MVAVGLYTSDYLSDGYLPVHMDSATELADYLDHVRDQMNMATQQLWKLMASWSRDQMIDAGMLVYSSVPRTSPTSPGSTSRTTGSSSRIASSASARSTATSTAAR